MGTGIRFKKNSAGIQALLSSRNVAELTHDKGEKVKSFAEGLSESGEAEYNVTTYTDGGRAITVVGTHNAASCYSNVKHGNALLKGLGDA